VIDGRSNLARNPLTTSIAVASAPVSFGAFEVTVGIDPHVPDAMAVLDAVQHAGYSGIDLGPPGYLGTGRELRDRLQRRGLQLAGGYIAIPFSEPQRRQTALDELGRVLEIFDSVDRQTTFPPRVTLADAGSDARRKTPGRAHDDPSLMLDRDGWARFAEGVKIASDICRQAGYQPTFHHHGASYVETPEEIERLLERTEVGLCLDTGHLVLGGGDPVSAARDWAERINHVHLKDVRRAVIDRVIAAEGIMMDFWREGAFCPLGDGDLDVDGVLASLGRHRYEGWLVVEQDMLPRPQERPDRAARDQQRNRQYLRSRGI
jgi:inosose dehydratase